MLRKIILIGIVALITLSMIWQAAAQGAGDVNATRGVNVTGTSTNATGIGNTGFSGGPSNAAGGMAGVNVTGTSSNVTGTRANATGAGVAGSGGNASGTSNRSTGSGTTGGPGSGFAGWPEPTFGSPIVPVSIFGDYGMFGPSDIFGPLGLFGYSGLYGPQAITFPNVFIAGWWNGYC